MDKRTAILEVLKAADRWTREALRKESPVEDSAGQQLIAAVMEYRRSSQPKVEIPKRRLPGPPRPPSFPAVPAQSGCRSRVDEFEQEDRRDSEPPTIPYRETDARELPKKTLLR